MNTCEWPGFSIAVLDYSAEGVELGFGAHDENVTLKGLEAAHRMVNQ